MEHDNDSTTTPSGKDVSWVKSKKQTKYFTYFFAKPVAINATTEEVWALEKDVKRYEQLSDHAVRARVKGELEVDKTIQLDLHTNTFIGKLIPTSNERISVIDEKNKVLGWERKFPFIKSPTERYALLEEDPNDPNKTIAYIGLKVPRQIGFFTNLFLKYSIEHAFDKLNNGIKTEAERHNPIPL
ncbi:hypothetical protein [Legionella waltersii]|uniref:Polyketide cyclase / dehydrase and lipid transport n=1 Tax=Legionella waltersii TaxID=66969 RepID=A0A0W1A773_9GAMM|nr:hypothetical protein [Legionella waltersii]KTD77161.1 hypothetical protein Lwal_1938 [Legionella waltersii]SNV11387.1 Uncharacterised protein [Legionella waltersii]